MEAKGFETGLTIWTSRRKTLILSIAGRLWRRGLCWHIRRCISWDFLASCMSLFWLSSYFLFLETALNKSVNTVYLIWGKTSTWQHDSRLQRSSMQWCNMQSRNTSAIFSNQTFCAPMFDGLILDSVTGRIFETAFDWCQKPIQGLHESSSALHSAWINWTALLGSLFASMALKNFAPTFDDTNACTHFMEC